MSARKAEPKAVKVVYRGFGQAVSVPYGGYDVEFPHGEPVEVPEELADRLTEGEEAVFFVEEARTGHSSE